jgi:N-acetylglucosamine-6-phosphate deacetylase
MAETLTSPGLFDLQVNGFAGVDFNDPSTTADQISRAIEAIRRTGVTRFLPTLITSSFESFAACARVLADHRDAAIAGLHVEGPYISGDDGYRGAHPKAHVRAASVDDFERRQEAARGRIRLLTLAPEVPGALPLIEHAVKRGVRVALGHTAAAPGQIRDGVLAGASLSTHLGNGCAQMIPRHPNVIWEQLANDALHASFIVDGHHLPGSTVKAMLRAKTPARSILVTDAIMAAGSPPGRYRLGGLEVELSADGRVAPPGAPHLAGSALTMDRAVGLAVTLGGVSIAEALAMASTQPAAFIGLAPAGTLSLSWEGGQLTVRSASAG